MNGQLVKTVVDEKQSAGKHSIVWNGRNDAGVKVASGVYFMQMRAGEFSQSRKMILLK
ncbi:MAG: FlgD immunoglobulin-like domain containing protein [Calditrichia bacterium]